MAYRFNFTGRKRIHEADAKIHVHKDARPLKVTLEQSFSASSRNLYSNDDLVMLEAIRRTKLRRYPLGIIGQLPPTITAEFPDFPNGEEVYYRLRIIDSQTHKLKGLAKTLKDADREHKAADLAPLLPVALSQPDDGLGDRFWMVKLCSNEDPVLIISSKKFNSYEPVKSPEFKALVLPEVLREVLTYAFIHTAFSEGLPEWAENWKTFVTVNLGVEGCPETSPEAPDENYIQETSQWIDDAVRAFAAHFNLSTISIRNLTEMEDSYE